MSEVSYNKEGVGQTARWVAAVRARESQREDRLINDPWAAALAGVEGENRLEQVQDADNGATIIIRVRFFDDFLVRVTTGEEIRQVVLLAAGLDTRAFRLAWPEQTRLFELDQPQVLDEKEQILAQAGATPTCERMVLKIDLTTQWVEPLRAAGFDVRQPAVWLLEGFLQYLPGNAGLHILDTISSIAAAGSWLGFDAINTHLLTSPWTRDWIAKRAEMGVPWLGTLDDPEGFLKQRGWDVTLTQAGEEGADFGRYPYPVIPPSLPNMPRYWFVTAQKK
jgi:methyltransferase (TIGR00027 family)